MIQIVDSEVPPGGTTLFVLMEYGESDFNKFLQSEPDLNMKDIKKYWQQMLE